MNHYRISIDPGLPALAGNRNGQSSSAPCVVLDDLFHGCALAAFVEVARHCQDWPPSEAVRRLAYDLYETELARHNATRTHRAPD